MFVQNTPVESQFYALLYCLQKSGKLCGNSILLSKIYLFSAEDSFRSIAHRALNYYLINLRICFYFLANTKLREIVTDFVNLTTLLVD